jgi:hypothetical protein
VVKKGKMFFFLLSSGLATKLPDQPFPRSATRKQGDQIGRIFANWVMVNFEKFVKTYRTIANFGLHFSQRTSWAFIYVDIKLVGLHFGRLFTKLSGHPA